jgi:hypothetical protein
MSYAKLIVLVEVNRRSMERFGEAMMKASIRMRRFANVLERREYGNGSLFHTWTVFGFDLGTFQFRARWFENHGWPRLYRDDWCWYLFAGPFEVSNRL